MDLSTLYAVYAGVLLACGGSLTITWRQNPTTVGPRDWALASGLGALALVIFAMAGLDKTQLWINIFANLVAWAGLAFYARGTRRFAGLRSLPAWMVLVYIAAAVVTVVLTLLLPYGPGIRIITGCVVFTMFSFDIVWSCTRRPMRSAPSYFIAFVFLAFGVTQTVRGIETVLDPTQMTYARPVDITLMFVGILGWGAIATGFSMLTTQRLLNERARSLKRLEEGVEHLREQFIGLAAGDYSVRAKSSGTNDPMDIVGQLFNDTATQIEQAFHEIDRQHSVLSATQESMLDGLLLVDKDLTILSANPAVAQLLEWQPAALPGKALADLVAPDDQKFASTLLERVSSGPIRERSTRFLTQDGTPLTLAVNGSAHRDGADAVQGAVLVVRDDRELKEAQAQLQMTDRLAAMGTVAAGVAHEINNPLAYVMSNVEFAIEELQGADDTLSPEDRKELIEALTAARKGSERARQIVRDLRNFTRSEEQEAGPVDINQLVDSAAAMLRNEVRHHARLDLSLTGRPSVRGNEGKLGQVFLNLIHNAAQAIPMGRAHENRIQVCTAEDQRGVVIEVRDTGEGIAEENLKRIFDAFFTTKPVGVGTGLGLAICHRVVANLGGRIEVSSELGKGSVFRVILPPAKPTPAPPPKSATETTAPAVEPRRVLVIDDEIEVGQSARRILGKLHQVDVASSAQEALERIQSTRYDVILCDLMMPEMTGMQLFSELKAQHPSAADRVIFMSGGVFGGDGEDFMRAQEHRCIAKPFDIKTLRGVVASGVPLR